MRKPLTPSLEPGTYALPPASWCPIARRSLPAPLCFLLPPFRQAFLRNPQGPVAVHQVHRRQGRGQPGEGLHIQVQGQSKRIHPIRHWNLPQKECRRSSLAAPLRGAQGRVRRVALSSVSPNFFVVVFSMFLPLLCLIVWNFLVFVPAPFPLPILQKPDRSSTPKRQNRYFAF